MIVPAAPQDLLRLEAFGALHYQHHTSTTRLLPKTIARWVAAASTDNVLDAYVRQGPLHTRGQQEQQTFAQNVASLQRDGILCADYRLRARIVDGRIHGAPLSAPLVTHIQLTHACNLKCTHCYVPVTAQAPAGEMTTQQVVALLTELSEIGCPVVVLAGGEPMRRPDFATIIDTLAHTDLDVTMCTNATLITEPLAEFLAASALRGVNVSLDGPDAETHDALRGQGQFVRAIRGTRRLIEAGQRKVKLRVTVTATNHKLLLAMAPLATELGVDAVVLKPFDQIGVADQRNELAISRSMWEEIAAHVRDSWPRDAPLLHTGTGMPTRAPKFTNIAPEFGCVGGTTVATVMPDGRVVGCGAVPAPQAWSIADHTFQDCWLHSPELGGWRKLPDNRQCRSCANRSSCGGGCRVRALAAGRGMAGPDPFADCSLYTPEQTRSPSANTQRPALRRLPMA